MSRSLSRKALVTGGTRGIGWAVAQSMLEAGHDVMVTGTRPGGSGPEGAAYHACDFADRAQVEAFCAELASANIDILVNNAGVNQIGRVEKYDVGVLERILLVNLVVPFQLCQAVLPHMIGRQWGRIVNIGSIFGVVSKEERAAYSSSKFGLVGLTKTLALEVARHDVMVNCVAPGFVDTDLTRRVLGEQGIAEMAQQVPAGRLARPEEIAAHVRFLAGEENTFMTGQVVVVDGGFTCA